MDFDDLGPAMRHICVARGYSALEQAIKRLEQHFHCARCGVVVLGTIKERYDPSQPGVKGWCDECQSSIRR